MVLDTPTAIIFLITLAFSVAALFAIAAHGQFRSLYVCALSPALTGVAYVLIALRGQISDLLSIVLGNMVMTSCFSVYAEAIYDFQERPAPRWVIWSPVLLIGAIFAWLLDAKFLGARVAIAGLVLSFLCALMITAVLQERSRTIGRGQYIFIAGGGIMMASLLFRLVASLSGRIGHGSVLDSGLLQSQTFIATIVSLVFCAMGLMMMRMERAEHTTRSASEALVKSEAHYRTLIESANEGICIRQDGYLCFANQKICELMGFTREEIIGRHFIDFVHESDQRMAIENYKRRLAGEVIPDKYALRLVTRHEGVRWFEVNGTTVEWNERPATLLFLNDITERKLLGEQVEQMAYLDALTGLPNRRSLMDHLQRELASNQRSGRHGALLFTDLDNFKPLNDTHGHRVGDVLLVECGQRLKAAVREIDFVARFGGDEFVVILGGLDGDAEQARQQALRVAEKVRLALSEPYHLEGGIEHVSNASIGVVLYRGDAGSEESLLQCADAAMYEAKRAGKNRVNLAFAV